MIYATLRIERNVIDALSEYRDRLTTARNRNPDAYPVWIRTGLISLSMAVEFLLLQQLQHSERSRRSRNRTPQRETIPLGLFSEGPLQEVADMIANREPENGVSPSPPEAILFGHQG